MPHRELWQRIQRWINQVFHTAINTTWWLLNLGFQDSSTEWISSQVLNVSKLLNQEEIIFSYYKICLFSIGNIKHKLPSEASFLTYLLKQVYSQSDRKTNENLQTYCWESLGSGRPNATTGKNGVITIASTRRERRITIRIKRKI